MHIFCLNYILFGPNMRHQCEQVLGIGMERRYLLGRAFYAETSGRFTVQFLFNIAYTNFQQLLNPRDPLQAPNGAQNSGVLLHEEAGRLSSARVPRGAFGTDLRLMRQPGARQVFARIELN